MILNKTNSDSGYACLVFGFRNGTSVLLGVFGVVAATLSIHPLLSSASRIMEWSDCIWSITNRFGTTIVAISTLSKRKLFYQTLICRHLPWYKKHIMLTILYTLANTITPSKCDNNVQPRSYMRVNLSQHLRIPQEQLGLDVSAAYWI